MAAGASRQSRQQWGVLRSLAMAFRTAVRPGTPGIGARVTSIPRLARATITGEYVGTTRGRLLMVLAAVLYVVSPVDLVPEMFVPFLGLADDALVVSWLAASLVNETESFLSWERDRDRTIRGDVIT